MSYSWWPVVNPKHGGRANLFGTWVPGAEPVVKGAKSTASKKRKAEGSKVAPPGMVALDDVLLWPLKLEENEKFPGGGKIPFAAMEYFRGGRQKKFNRMQVRSQNMINQPGSVRPRPGNSPITKNSDRFPCRQQRRRQRVGAASRGCGNR